MSELDSKKLSMNSTQRGHVNLLCGSNWCDGKLMLSHREALTLKRLSTSSYRTTATSLSASCGRAMEHRQGVLALVLPRNSRVQRSGTTRILTKCESCFISRMRQFRQVRSTRS